MSEAAAKPRSVEFAVAAIAMLATSLWLGSLVHMLLSVATLFRRFPKAASSIAVESAPVLFHMTERANLVFALLAVVGTCAWRYLAGDRRLLWAINLLLAATVLGLVQAFYISARMDGLRLSGLGDSDAFKRLHGLSSVQYLAQTALVLGAMLVYVSAPQRTRLAK